MNNTNEYISRSDFIFFQNEILGDVKNLETKLNDKLSQTTSFVETQYEKSELRIKELTNRVQDLSIKLEENNNTKQFENILNQSQQKLEDLLTKIEVKLSMLERDFNDACFKYDKMFTNNLTVPGLIGNSCPYENLKPFLEYTNQKLVELLKHKEKQIIDTKRYKEKLESIIGQNKTHFETAQNKIQNYCSKGFQQCENTCKDRMSIMEKRIEALRIENGEYSFDLKKKSDELQIKWDKLDKIENHLNERFNQEWDKYIDIVGKIGEKVDKSWEEFYLIKKRFTELSEFIKDVRFRKNVSDPSIEEEFKQRRLFKKMSNKIDFSKKQKKFQNFEKKEILSNFYNNQIIQENDDRINEEMFDNNYNSNEISEINNNDNKIYKKFDENKNKKEYIIKNNKNEIKNIKDTNNQINDKINQNKLNIENDLDKEKINNINNNIQNKKNINDLNMNNTFEKQSNNVFKIDKTQNIKYINIKDKYNKMNNDNNNTITNNIVYLGNNNTNRNKSNNINYSNSPKSKERNNINKEYKEEKEQDKSNLLYLAENIKISNLVLGADFNRNNLYNVNAPAYNLSQAYILVKKKNEEMQKMKKTHGGKSEPKFQQMTPVTINNNSRSNLNYFSIKDLKNNNKEDLYFNTLRKGKLKNLSSYQNIFLNQENLNNLDKNNFPIISKDGQRLVNESTGEKNIMYNSYINDSINKIQKNNSNSTQVNFNSININENSFDNKSLPSKGRNIKKNHKKLLYSSSEINLPINPHIIYKDYVQNKNENIDKNDNIKYTVDLNAKEAYNKVNSYLIKKFKDE